MEYKINSFNLADINFNDLSDLQIYFDNQIFKQEIHNILLGPNLINIVYPNENNNDAEECEKIFNVLTRLLLGNLEAKTDQSFLINSTTHSQAKDFLANFIHSINKVIIEDEKQTTQQNLSSLKYLHFINLFTCFRDKLNDEISICGNLIIIYIH